MSEDNIDAAVEVSNVCCASCGKAEIDDVKLKPCDKCDLAHYCGDECQENHLETHEAICKERAAELRDELLFKQPECSHLGDCPICFLPLPLDIEQSAVQACCGKVICKGCAYFNAVYENEQGLNFKCPFCRHPVPEDSDKVMKKKLKKRLAMNDPAALRQMGGITSDEGDHESAFKYYKRAADLGDVLAHRNLSVMYHNGEGVEKDEEMELYHLEVAAIAGDPGARDKLAMHELKKQQRVERAVKHWIIAANLGHNNSLQNLKECYKCGVVSKDDLAAALRAYQAAVDAMKSPQREEVEAFCRQERGKNGE